jgi:hypothetical protein
LCPQERRRVPPLRRLSGDEYLQQKKQVSNGRGSAGGRIDTTERLRNVDRLEGLLPDTGTTSGSTQALPVPKSRQNTFSVESRFIRNKRSSEDLHKDDEATYSNSKRSRDQVSHLDYIDGGILILD